MMYGTAAKCDTESLFIYMERYAPLNVSIHFVLLNLSKSSIWGYPQIIHFSNKSVWLTYFDIFSQVRVRCVVNSLFHPPVLMDFSIALAAI